MEFSVECTMVISCLSPTLPASLQLPAPGSSRGLASSLGRRTFQHRCTRVPSWSAWPQAIPDPSSPGAGQTASLLMFTTPECWETATSWSQILNPSMQECMCAEPPLLAHEIIRLPQPTSLCLVKISSSLYYFCISSWFMLSFILSNFIIFISHCCCCFLQKLHLPWWSGRRVWRVHVPALPASFAKLKEFPRPTSPGSRTERRSTPMVVSRCTTGLQPYSALCLSVAFWL